MISRGGLNLNIPIPGGGFNGHLGAHSPLFSPYHQIAQQQQRQVNGSGQNGSGPNGPGFGQFPIAGPGGFLGGGAGLFPGAGGLYGAGAGGFQGPPGNGYQGGGGAGRCVGL